MTAFLIEADLLDETEVLDRLQVMEMLPFVRPHGAHFRERLRLPRDGSDHPVGRYTPICPVSDISEADGRDAVDFRDVTERAGAARVGAKAMLHRECGLENT